MRSTGPCPFAAAPLLLPRCAPDAPPAPRTLQQRAALSDTILARTARREAFSAPKHQALGFDALTDMRALREDLVNATSEEALASLGHPPATRTRR